MGEDHYRLFIKSAPKLTDVMRKIMKDIFRIDIEATGVDIDTNEIIGLSSVLL